MATKKRKTRTSYIYCVEKDYGSYSEVLYCFTSKKSADKVSNANRGVTTRKKKLIKGAW